MLLDMQFCLDRIIKRFPMPNMASSRNFDTIMAHDVY